MSDWPEGVAMAYGGDYNPEQWPREVWDEDVALMREAGVNLVSIGIFSWALLEPEEGRFDFGWLDDVVDLLHTNGIMIDLGTPTASPPAWFYATYPGSRVVTRDGTVLGFGARGMVSHSSSAYREASARIAGELARRYGTHPGVVLWHVHNEYGAPVSEDYSPASVEAFRGWLRAKYGTIAALNAAWGTTFWGQRYTRWEHIGAPAVAASVVNPAQRLDFARFTDEALLRRRTGRDPRAQCRPGHDELPGPPLPGHRPVEVGARGRHRLQRPLPAGRGRAEPRRARDGGRPHPVRRGRQAVDPDGALDVRGELAAAQRRQAKG
jgi:glycosyl hydrolase family 42 (putative beta-galactosidase)